MIKIDQQKKPFQEIEKLLLQSIYTILVSSYVVSNLCPNFWNELPNIFNACVVKTDLTVFRRQTK